MRDPAAEQQTPPGPSNMPQAAAAEQPGSKSGSKAEVRRIQGLGLPPRVTSGFHYRQSELDTVVEHFLGIMPDGIPQGHGSPL
eukprot:7754488-Karenia_brevis.AAC.1